VALRGIGFKLVATKRFGTFILIAAYSAIDFLFANSRPVITSGASRRLTIDWESFRDL